MIVHADSAVTLLGGGDLPAGDLDRALDRAPRLVAADGGGVAAALAAGRMPDAVIGDLDSLDTETRARLPAERVHAIEEQTSTDFDKALRNIDAPGVLAIGVTGRRIDHELAAYHSLITCPAPPCIVIGATDIAFHAPPRLGIALAPGTRVSLFPMAPVVATGTGLLWPVDALALSPLGRIGTSNTATEDTVTLEVDAQGLLVILPRAALDAAIAALF